MVVCVLFFYFILLAYAILTPGNANGGDASAGNGGLAVGSIFGGSANANGGDAVGGDGGIAIGGNANGGDAVGGDGGVAIGGFF